MSVMSLKIDLARSPTHLLLYHYQFSISNNFIQNPVSYINTLHNVCAVHRGRGCAVHWGMFSTLGDIIEYTRVFSTLEDIMTTLVVFSTVADTMSTVGDTMISVGDIMSTLEGYHEYTGGYHDECGGTSEYTDGCSVHWGFHTNPIVFSMTFPHIYHDIPPVY